LSTDFKKKSSNIEYPENMSSWSRSVPCGHTDGQTNMMKLTVTFWNFVNEPKYC